MAKAIALTTAHFNRIADPMEFIRPGIVLACGLALIAAGPFLPSLSL